MTIKVYFDCTWTGPQVNVDANGKKVNTDDSVKGQYTQCLSLSIAISR